MRITPRVFDILNFWDGFIGNNTLKCLSVWEFYRKNFLFMTEHWRPRISFQLTGRLRNFIFDSYSSLEVRESLCKQFDVRKKWGPHLVLEELLYIWPEVIFCGLAGLAYEVSSWNLVKFLAAIYTRRCHFPKLLDNFLEYNFELWMRGTLLFMAISTRWASFGSPLSTLFSVLRAYWK